MTRSLRRTRSGGAAQGAARSPIAVHRLGRRVLVELPLLLMLLGPAGSAHAGEWKCLSGAGGAVRLLSFEGGIESGEHKRFRAAFADCFPASYTGQRTIDLDSGGGNVAEALAIANDVASAGAGARPVGTQVTKNSVCISACTYLFVSGRLRNVTGGGSFEPHGFSSFLGRRIDDAIQVARGEDGQIRWPALNLQTQRLRVLANWLPELAQGDSRLQFAPQWMDEPGQQLRLGRWSAGASRAVVERFLALPAAQRTFIQDMDAIIRTVVPELERVAALQAFEPVLTAAGSASVSFDERRYFQWVMQEVEAAANTYLRSSNDKRPVKLGEEFQRVVLVALRERVSASSRLVRDDLAPYLQSRADHIDVPGLVKLMFSVSILYTRPLTREELCDLNIVNRDCAN